MIEHFFTKKGGGSLILMMGFLGLPFGQLKTFWGFLQTFLTDFL